MEDIFEVTRAAFEVHPYSARTEQFIVNALRAAAAPTVSLVAQIDGSVAGQIAYPPAAVSGGCYGFGPISVPPRLQRQGIGKILLGEGLSRLKALEAKGCVLVGDPACYTRIGFRNSSDLVHDGRPSRKPPCPVLR